MEQMLAAIQGYSNWNQIVEWIVRIVLSLICGVCIGYERKNRQQIVGIRTLLLICISATLLGILSEYVAMSTISSKGDPGRVSAAVVTGLGFIGGGAIMHRGLNVRGVTTAALIWSTAAIGLALGDGLYIPAIVVFVLIMTALPAFQKYEAKRFPAEKIRTLSLWYSDEKVDFAVIRRHLEERKMIIKDVSITNNVKKEVQEIDIFVYTPADIDVFDLNEALKKTGKLIKFSFTE